MIPIHTTNYMILETCENILESRIRYFPHIYIDRSDVVCIVYHCGHYNLYCEFALITDSSISILRLFYVIHPQFHFITVHQFQIYLLKIILEAQLATRKT